MSDWEFLLQKEGDDTWLPLESADVEILEGRYRIVANTYMANTEVQIQIIHDYTEEIPPVRRVHKRSSRTHSQGLISIIPFTRLKPGRWEFRCQPKLTTSSIETKTNIVHLEVLPTEYDTSDFSQQLDPQNQELYVVADSKPEPTDLITNENTSFFSGQIDTDEVAINLEKNTVKNNSELAKFEAIKSDETELLDAQIQEESETMENITDLLDSDEQDEQNIQSQNQEVKNIENQLKELTETLIKNSSILGQVKQEQEIELEAKKETDTDTTTQTNSILNYPLELTLEQASYIAQPGEALIISGQIILDNQNQNIQSSEGFNNLSLQNNLTEKDSAITENNAPLVNGNLKISLRNPQTSETLIDVQHTLPEQVPPIIFACTISVPENIKTHLILGQIILTEHTETLANKSFTITTPLQNWLTAIDDNFVEDEHQGITPKTNLAARKPEQKSPSFQELVEKINQSQPEQKPDKDQPLPPQIYQPVIAESDSESLKLPKFGNRLPDNMAKDATQINDLLAKSNAPTDSDEMDDVWENSDRSQEQTSSQPEIEESESETVNKEEAPNTKQNLVPFPTKFAPINKAFKALKLEDRFFSRLNSLINDSELLQWMKNSSLPPTDATDKSTKLENTLESKQKTEIEELPDNDSISVIVDDQEFASDNDDKINWEAQEFVVEDEDRPEQILPNQEKQWSMGLGNLPQQQDESISTQPYILPDEQPVPIPDLEVLAKDVIAGRAVKVRVQLPEGLPRIYVKIWVYDRQAQTIVAGPRWLTDFIPNGMGQVEVITELDIAYGCLEIKFEAIAAEVQTNRESHKAVIERLVVAPPPPKLPFDDLS